MKYCKSCGARAEDNAKFCENCGEKFAESTVSASSKSEEAQCSASTEEVKVTEPIQKVEMLGSGETVKTETRTEGNQTYTRTTYTSNGRSQTSNSNAEDTPSVGLNVLGFLIPLAALIMYLVMKDTTPVRAKSVGKWGLIGFGVGIGLQVLAGIFSVLAGLFIMSGM